MVHPGYGIVLHVQEEIGESVNPETEGKRLKDAMLGARLALDLGGSEAYYVLQTVSRTWREAISLHMNVQYDLRVPKGVPIEPETIEEQLELAIFPIKSVTVKVQRPLRRLSQAAPRFDFLRGLPY